jgi:hypothetical protein
MSGERREHHLHDAASLDPVSAEDRKCSDHVDQICRKEDQEAVQKLHGKQLLSFDRETVVKVNLLFGMQIQKSGQSEDHSRCCHQNAQERILKSKNFSDEAQDLRVFQGICPDLRISGPVHEPVFILFSDARDPHGRRHRHCKEECEQGKSDRPESSFHVLFHKFKK